MRGARNTEPCDFGRDIDPSRSATTHLSPNFWSTCPENPADDVPLGVAFDHEPSAAGGSVWGAGDRLTPAAACVG